MWLMYACMAHSLIGVVSLLLLLSLLLSLSRAPMYSISLSPPHTHLGLILIVEFHPSISLHLFPSDPRDSVCRHARMCSCERALSRFLSVPASPSLSLSLARSVSVSFYASLFLSRVLSLSLSFSLCLSLPHTHTNTHTKNTHTHIHTHAYAQISYPPRCFRCGVATICDLLMMSCLVCKRPYLEEIFFAKETA